MEEANEQISKSILKRWDMEKFQVMQSNAQTMENSCRVPADGASVWRRNYFAGGNLQVAGKTSWRVNLKAYIMHTDCGRY